MRILLISIFFLVIVVGCLEPSDVSLFQNSEPSIVIEGNINNTDTIHHIYVSQTVYGESSKNKHKVNSATVWLINQTNNTQELLLLDGEGVYVSKNTMGIIGNKYKLEVNVNQMVYEASEQITQKPEINNVLVEYEDDDSKAAGYYIYYSTKVNLDSIGYYKLEVTRNGIYYNNYEDLMVYSDQFYKENQTLLVPYRFNLLDTVQIKILSLSYEMYEYYNGLIKQTANVYSNIQPPMVNPENNFSPTVLGYFQASSIYVVDTIIQDPVSEE